MIFGIEIHFHLQIFMNSVNATLLCYLSSISTLIKNTNINFTKDIQWFNMLHLSIVLQDK